MDDLGSYGKWWKFLPQKMRCIYQKLGFTGVIFLVFRRVKNQAFRINAWVYLPTCGWFLNDVYGTVNEGKYITYMDGMGSNYNYKSLYYFLQLKGTYAYPVIKHNPLNFDQPQGGIWFQLVVYQLASPCQVDVKLVIFFPPTNQQL